MDSSSFIYENVYSENSNDVSNSSMNQNDCLNNLNNSIENSMNSNGNSMLNSMNDNGKKKVRVNRRTFIFFKHLNPGHYRQPLVGDSRRDDDEDAFDSVFTTQTNML